MYIESIVIRNIRAIRDFSINFTSGKYAGWHVIIGDNGSGKSTFTRSVALALVGPSEAKALRQNWSDWLNNSESTGRIKVNIDHNVNYDKSTGRGGSTSTKYISATLLFRRTKLSTGSAVILTDVSNKNYIAPSRYIWGSGNGWFCASYGPFRRFTGGNKEFEKLYYSNPKLAPHLSAFGEDVALTESIEWLKSLHFKHLEKKQEGEYLSYLVSFINDGELLPFNTKINEITSEGVMFTDGNDCEVAVEQLSDGYRSILSMTFELIRQLVRVYGPVKVFKKIKQGEMYIDLPGVVLIDEIDAHLHPTWQRRVGQWFIKYFPKLQFIVTTHSPLICQAAEKGTVWRLPSPGNESDGGQIEGIELQRLIYGNILEAYNTELFGSDISRSDSSQKMLHRLAVLNNLSLKRKLNSDEIKELSKLRSIMPTEVNATNTGD